MITVPANLGSALMVLYSGTILTDDSYNDVAPTWDPSSGFIAFSTTRRWATGGAFTNGGNRTIWTMTSAGQIISQITGAGNSTYNDDHPGWSDGNVVTFQSDRSNGNNIWVIDATAPESSGGTAKQVTGTAGDPLHPAFIPYVKGIDFDQRAGTTCGAGQSPPSCINWAKLLQAPLEAAIVETRAGGSGVASDCEPNTTRCYNQNAFFQLKDAQANGLLTGVYVWLTADQPGALEVDSALSRLQNSSDPLTDVRTPLRFVALDIEKGCADPTPGPTCTEPTPTLFQEDPTIASGIICDALLRIAIQWHETPVIYTNIDSWTTLFKQAPKDPICGDFSMFPLWEAKVDLSPDIGNTYFSGNVRDSSGNLKYPKWTRWTKRIGKQWDQCLSSPASVRSKIFPGVPPYGVDYADLDSFDSTLRWEPTGSFLGLTGSDIVNQPVNQITSTSPIVVTYSTITQSGITSLTSSSAGSAPPNGYKPVTPQVYYDVTTTAVYTGPIQVCLNYTGVGYGVQTNLALFHYVNNAWVNATSSSNPASNILCGSVTSLSPFAIFELGAAATPIVNVTGGTFTYDGTAHNATAAAIGLSGQSISGTFTFTYTPGGSAAPVNPGTYTVTAQFASADPNYSDATGTGTITITAPSQTATTVTTASMQFPRVSHQATLLADGLVLVSGGQIGGAAIPQSELYNPTAADWSLSGNNVIPRFDHTATLLQDGRVLAAGGVSSKSECSLNVTAETYDPTTGQWSLTRRLPSPVGTGHAAIRMQDGRVLVTGGGDRCGAVFNTAQIFNPTSNQWSTTASMNVARQFHTIALLPDGRVLVAGGITSSSHSAVPSAEIYDPTAGTWTPVGSMSTARQTACNGYTQTFLANLPSGSILAAGGFSGSNCPAITPQRTVAAAKVNPSSVQLFNIGQTLALSVTAQMSDGSTEPFTGPLQFSSGDTTVVTVDSSGIVTAVGTGTTAITVSGTGISPVNVPVTIASRQLTSISVSPTSIVAIGPGVLQPLAVNGQYSDGSEQAVTTGLTFTSSNTAVATVDPTGLLTTLGNGTATITVSAQGVPSAQVTVLVKSLVSIVVSPTSLTLNGLGQTQALTVTGLYSDGSQQVLTANLSYTSSNPLVAQVNLSGFVTAVANGTATITVSVSGVAAIQVPVTVAAPLLSITKSHSGSFTQGQQGAAYTILVSNAAGAGPSTGTITVTDTVPTGLTLASMAGTGWVCGAASCTRGGALAAGGSYPPIAVLVKVANNAASSVTNTATVSGGGSASAVAADLTTITAGTPVILSVSPNSGQQGQQNDSVTLTGQFTNWVQGTTTASFGAGVTVASLTVNSNTSATAVLNIDPAASSGARTVTVTTGSEVETLSSGFTISASSTTCRPAPSGLVSWWAGEGSTSDLLGANNPTASNAVSFVPGEVGTGFSFGSGGYIDIPASEGLANPQFTLSAWVRPDGPGPNEDFLGDWIVGQDIDDSDTSVLLSWRNSDDRFTFVDGNISSEQIVSQDAFPPGNFYLVTASYDGLTFTLYVNGQIEATRSVQKTTAYSSTTWTIGSSSANIRGQGFPRTWNGVIDEVQAFNRPLLQSEIQSVYAAGSLGECKGSPVISLIGPNAGQQGQQNLAISLAGQFTNWAQGTTTVSFGAGVTVASFNVTSATSALAIVNIDPATTLGPQAVTMTTGSEVETLPDGFTVTGPPDLVIVKSHIGNFIQGQSGVTYTITITNIGTGPTSGAVTMSDTLPAALTATAISGLGWSCTVASLTCSRSDILDASSNYPAITVTVSVATNAGSSVTNSATVSGGGEVNITNDSASDVTEIVPPTNTGGGEYDASLGTLPQAQGWSYSGDNGNPSPVVSGGILDENTTAGGQNWSITDSSIDLSQDAVLVAVLKIDSSNYIPDIGTGTREGYYIGIGDSASGYTVGIADAGININSIGVSGQPLTPFPVAGAFHIFRLAIHDRLADFSIDGVDLASNVQPTTISFGSGVVLFGGAAGRSLSVSELSLLCYGNSATACSQTSLPSIPDLTIAISHTGQFLQGRIGASYVITVTNSGSGPTAGAISTTDTLPTGLTATALSGEGWNCTLATLSCTRSDALAVSASYPAITLTVNVANDAGTLVTNTATVSGGGELNTTNDTATDNTTVLSSNCLTSASDLVSWWSGDGNTNDLLGANNPSASSAVSFVPGEVDTGFAFGPGGFIDIPASQSLANQRFTWSAWVRPDGPGPNNDSFGSVIVGQEIDGSHASAEILWRAMDNRFLFIFGDVSSELIVSQDTFAPGQFYLVTGTYDGSAFSLFVNGNLEGQYTEAKTIAYASSGWTIGSANSASRGSGFPRTWNGVIDEVQAFNRSLLQTEIQAIFNAGSLGECKGTSPISSVAPNAYRHGQRNLQISIAGQFTDTLDRAVGQWRRSSCASYALSQPLKNASVPWRLRPDGPIHACSHFFVDAFVAKPTVD
jgi:uncharacterized repeat protein (TIGR01451 family)